MPPKFKRPELLQHPNIPKPLHEMTPQKLMGKEWWDVHRWIAYTKNRFHCWACGVYKGNALFHQWLEAHPDYTIDYPKGRMEVNEITALCHACHSFVHSGLLIIRLENKEITESQFKQIVLHGLGVLKEAGLEPWPGTLKMLAMMFPKRQLQTTSVIPGNAVDTPREEMAPWSEWHVVMPDGTTHWTHFEDMESWAMSFYESDFKRIE